MLVCCVVHLFSHVKSYIATCYKFDIAVRLLLSYFITIHLKDLECLLGERLVGHATYACINTYI